jgi:hypothetical protein
VHLVFETKQRRKRSARRVRRSRWGATVAEVGKLKFDRRSLFFDERGRYLHNYTSLSQTGFKIEPTMPGTTEQQERDGDEAKQTSAKSHGAFCFKGEVCDESVAREGCGTTQPLIAHSIESVRFCSDRVMNGVLPKLHCDAQSSRKTICHDWKVLSRRGAVRPMLGSPILPDYQNRKNCLSTYLIQR